MIHIDDTIISEMLLEKKFVCNLNACKGACCVEGDAGAPLEEDELKKLEEVYPIVKDYLSEQSIKALEKDLYTVDVDDEFTVQLTKAEAKAKMGSFKVVEQFNEWGEVIEGAADSVYEDYSAQDIIEYRLKEEWFFDRERSIMDVRILGISPVRNNIDENTGESKGKVAMFWVYFPEARYVFANYDVFNRQNDAERRTFEDIFWKRMFNSYIVKRSNVYDRSNLSYLKGLDLLLEGDKIKEDIFNYEHDLWHF